MRIAVDAMGGDHAPREIVRGAIDYAAASADEVILVGDVPRLEREIVAYGNAKSANIRLLDAPEVIGMGEHPATALRSKRRASIVVATNLVRQGEADAVVSAGSTGATMAAAVFRLGRIDGIDRPALPAHMITPTGPVMLLDVGANVDSDAENLVQFAAMGAIFAEQVLHVANPRIGLLNIGEESEKGHAMAREAYEKLSDADLNFVGNVEANDMVAHAADVVVCDGFVGNVLLKFYESSARVFVGLLKERIPDAFDRPAMADLNRILDYSTYGGAPLLGIKGVSIVCHGSSSPNAIKNAIRVAVQAARAGLSQHIGAEFAQRQTTAPA